MRYLPNWLPGTAFKRVAARMRKTLDDLAEMPMELVRHDMARGTAKPSFVSKQYNDEMNELEKHDTKWTAASLYAAGADTVGLIAGEGCGNADMFQDGGGLVNILPCDIPAS